MKVEFTVEHGGMYLLTIITENDVEAVALRVWSDLHDKEPELAVLLIRPQASDGSLGHEIERPLTFNELLEKKVTDDLAVALKALEDIFSTPIEVFGKPEEPWKSWRTLALKCKSIAATAIAAIDQEEDIDATSSNS